MPILEDTFQENLWHLIRNNALDRCIFCNALTRYMYKKRRKPVCTLCAEDRLPSEIPLVRKRAKHE